MHQVSTIGRCKSCKKTHSRTLFWNEQKEHWGDATGVWLPPLKCCDQLVYEQHIKGSTNHTKCDARCWRGKSPSCSCSCGGANHGRAYRTCGCSQRQPGEDNLCTTCGDPVPAEG